MSNQAPSDTEEDQQLQEVKAEISSLNLVESSIPNFKRQNDLSRVQNAAAGLLGIIQKDETDSISGIAPVSPIDRQD